MHILAIVLGLVLLVLGRRLFWLFVAVVGFLLGVEFAGVLLADHPKWVVLLVGLGTGLLGALLAVLAERVAFALGGFYAGAYLALLAAHTFWGGDAGLLWFLVGGVIGAVFAALIMDWALIVLSCLVGAGAIIGAVGLGQATGALAFVVLTIAGIIVQGKLMARSKGSQPE
jgi:hypothetical protein